MSTDPDIERGDLAVALIKARTVARLSQRDLAALSTVSLATIRDIETGKQRRPKPDTLRLLAGGLVTPVDGKPKDDDLWEAYASLSIAAGYVDENVPRGRLAQTAVRLRTELGLDRVQLASRSGLSVEAIAEIEDGRQTQPGIDTIGSLARGLATRRDGSVDEQGILRTYTDLTSDAGYNTAIWGLHSDGIRISHQGLEVGGDALTRFGAREALEKSINRLSNLVSTDRLPTQDLQTIGTILGSLLERFDPSAIERREAFRNRRPFIQRFSSRFPGLEDMREWHSLPPEALASIGRLLNDLWAIPEVTTLGGSTSEDGISFWVFLSHPDVEAESKIAAAERTFLDADPPLPVQLHVFRKTDEPQDMPTFVMFVERNPEWNPERRTRE